MTKVRILVTGSGGLAGVNFVRALRASKKQYFIAGTDFNRYHLNYPEVDVRRLSLRHSDPRFVEEMASLVREERIDFLHPQPSSEAYVLSEARRKIRCRMLLPSANVMMTAQDKLLSQEKLSRVGVPVARTRTMKDGRGVAEAFGALGGPLWVRARHGAGGRLSLLCRTPGEASHWIDLWILRGAAREEFILQEYLPGRNLAWDSLWRRGRLVTSYARERLEYPFKHISPSGITGTPSVARIVLEAKVNEVARRAVKAIDPNPDGAYSVDIKESEEGNPCVTEVDAGKFHSTMPLWGYIAVKHLRMPWYANLADLYVRLGLGEDAPRMPATDLFPEGYYLLREMDVGAYLWREDGWKEKVL